MLQMMKQHKHIDQEQVIGDKYRGSTVDQYRQKNQQNGEIDYISQRLEAHLTEVKHTSSQQIVKSIYNDFYRHYGPPDDDATLIAVKKC